MVDTHIPHKLRIATRAEKLEENGMGRVQSAAVQDRKTCFRDHMAFGGLWDLL